MFGDSAALRRFEREAQASARLSHPNIVRVYDYGAVGNAGAFLILEMLHGKTLRAELHRAGPMHPRDAARVFAGVFAGVAAAHEAGVIHRDLKPENVLLADDAKGGVAVKLLDFGLAKLRRPAEEAAADAASSLTTPGTVMGTFGYMSPEQLAGGEVDERSDVFSLGVMVYEALVGRKPYAARTWVDLIAATTVGNVRLPGDGREVRRLETAIRRCLAGNVRDRYASVVEAWRDLQPAILACPPFGAAPAASAERDPTKLYGKPIG
jgi:serine/threonine protein kinase